MSNIGPNIKNANMEVFDSCPVKLDAIKASASEQSDNTNAKSIINAVLKMEFCDNCIIYALGKNT